MKKRIFVPSLVIFLTLCPCGCSLNNNKELTVTFMVEDSIYETQVVKKGEKVSKPEDPTLVGHAFNSWYDAKDKEWNFDDYSITKDTTLYAKFVANKYTITFNTNGGEAIDPMEVSYGEYVKLPTPQYYLSPFNGWYKDNLLIESGNYIFDCDITLVAKWEWHNNVSVISPSSYLNSKEAKQTLDTYTSSNIYFNYLTDYTEGIENAISGLVSFNEFGGLTLNAAESATHNTDYTEFTFTVRQDESLLWCNYHGEPYRFNNEIQYVKAEDFYNSVKYALTYKYVPYPDNFLMNTMVGAAEYHYYTKIFHGILSGNEQYVSLNTDAKKANWINQTIKANNPAITKSDAWKDIEAGDIQDIANGNRLGVKVDKSNNKITYQLYFSSPHFPTLLTRSPYLPVNSIFLQEKGSTFGKGEYGPSCILYCGPYLIYYVDEDKTVFIKNPYHEKRHDLPDCLKANISIIRLHYRDNYNNIIENEYLSGDLDTFKIPIDNKHWQKYIAGPNNEGNLTNPYNEYVDISLDKTLFTYGGSLLLERTKDADSNVSYSSYGNAQTIANTEKALRLADVRKAIAAAYDCENYFNLFWGNNYDSLMNTRHASHTLIPGDTFYDDNGNEYVNTYYAAELAKKRNITLEEAQSQLKRGNIDNKQQSQETINTLVNKAQQSIDAYNASPLADKYGQITYPIQIETYGVFDDASYSAKNRQFIEIMNKRINNISDVGNNYSNCNIFRFVPTDKYKTRYTTYPTIFDFNYDYENLSRFGEYYFEDPSTFLSRYIKNGSASKLFKYVALDYVPNIIISNDEVIESDLLGEYTDLVAHVNDGYTNQASYLQKCAEIEVKLIEDLTIFMPELSYHQEYTLTISNVADFGSVKSPFNQKSLLFSGSWSLTTPLTRAERQTIQSEYDTAKVNYFVNHNLYSIY